MIRYQFFMFLSLLVSSLSAATSAPINLQTQDALAIGIQNAIDCFADKNNLFHKDRINHNDNIVDFAKIIRLKLLGETANFFGIHQNFLRGLNKSDFASFKQAVLAEMGMTGKQILQIVGDSGLFSPEGTVFGRNFLRKYLESDCVIEYGYTGHQSGNVQLDTNSFINEFIDAHPDQANRVLANVVGHTVWAIQQWHCYVSPHVRNFVTVYNNSGMNETPQYEADKQISGFTTFGTDVLISDFIGLDKLICLEGGAQSFQQIVNALLQDIPVDLVYNLRTSSGETMFSAARFLKLIDDEFTEKQQLSKEVIIQIFNKYKSSLASMFNEAKQDFKTKQALFDAAMHLFIENNLFQKVHVLCKFYDAKTSGGRKDILWNDPMFTYFTRKVYEDQKDFCS